MFSQDPRPDDHLKPTEDPLRRLHAGADVLALLADPATAPLCLDMAEDAARAVHGSMAAAHIGSEPLSLILSADEIDMIQLRDHAQGLSRQRFDQVNQAFSRWRRGHLDRRAVFLDDCRGDVERCVAAECVESQLVVATRHGSIDAREAFRSVIFNAHKLVLAPPARGYRGDLLRHVVIGWKPHGHTRSAVIAARRWLDAADRVTMLCVNDTPERTYQRSAGELLTRLELKAGITAIHSSTRSIGEAIVDFARTEEATCLLIGAFKYGYLLELLLGRITPYVLSHAPMPVMMRH
jgi:nucleotide-binding universal stress UspA family protein